MPPKPIKNTLALIWWINSGEKDIITITKLPKRRRNVNDTVQLCWKNHQTGIIEKCPAKILQLGNNYDSLNKIPLDSDGNIRNDRVKLFSESVIAKSNELSEGSKTIERSSKCQKMSEEHKIATEAPLFDKNTLNQPKKINTPTEKTKTNDKSKSNQKQNVKSKSNIKTRQASLKDNKICNVTSTKILKNSTKDNEINMLKETHNFNRHKNIQDNNHKSEERENHKPLNLSSENKEDQQCPSVTEPNEIANNSISEFIQQTTSTAMIEPEISRSNTTVLVPRSLNQKIQQFSSSSERNEGPPEFDDMNVLSNTNSPTVHNKNNLDINVEPCADDEFEKIEDDVGAFHTFISVDVTKRDLQVFYSILKRLKEIHEHQKKRNPQLSNILKMPDEYNIPGENKKELYANSKIFLPSKKIEKIEEAIKMKDGKNNWKKFTKLILAEIYGNTIGNYCCQGKRDSPCPGIDEKLFKAIYAWVITKCDQSISMTAYISEINSICYKARNQNISSSKKLNENGKLGSDEVSESNLRFFNTVYLGLKKIVKWEESSEMMATEMEEVLEDYITPDSTKKVKIANDYHIYFPKDTVSYLEKRSTIKPNISDWRQLVREALLEVYGSQLYKYSAKGKGKNSLPIDDQLFHAIYEWANRRAEDEISMEDYIDHINKTTGNKKKYKKSKLDPSITSNLQTNEKDSTQELYQPNEDFQQSKELVNQPVLNANEDVDSCSDIDHIVETAAKKNQCEKSKSNSSTTLHLRNNKKNTAQKSFQPNEDVRQSTELANQSMLNLNNGVASHTNVNDMNKTTVNKRNIIEPELSPSTSVHLQNDHQNTIQELYRPIQDFLQPMSSFNNGPPFVTLCTNIDQITETAAEKTKIIESNSIATTIFHLRNNEQNSTQELSQPNQDIQQITEWVNQPVSDNASTFPNLRYDSNEHPITLIETVLDLSCHKVVSPNFYANFNNSMELLNRNN